MTLLRACNCPVLCGLRRESVMCAAAQDSVGGMLGQRGRRCEQVSVPIWDKPGGCTDSPIHGRRIHIARSLLSFIIANSPVACVKKRAAISRGRSPYRTTYGRTVWCVLISGGRGGGGGVLMNKYEDCIVVDGCITNKDPANWLLMHVGRGSLKNVIFKNPLLKII